MASTPVDGGDTNADQSYFQKTVCLFDWWLIKHQNDVGGGNRLAVAGVASEMEEARRVFSSAPIAKRFDVFTLETVDGICIVLKGFINKERTIDNGFPSEVFTQFLFGFPPYWEQWEAKYLGGDSTTSTVVSGRNSDADKSPTNPGGVETPVEQVSGEDKHDAEVPEQFSSKVSMNVAADNPKVDDLPKHAAEEDTGRANIGSSDIQSICRPKHLGGNQKKPVEAVESLGGEPGATTQSVDKVNNTSERYPRGKVSRSVSRVTRGKGKEKQMAGSGLNSERNTVDYVPSVSKTLSISKVRGRSTSHPSDSELQEPNKVNAIKRLDFGFIEDDLQHSGHAKQGQNCGNVTAQVGKGESDAKKENASRKKTNGKTTFDTKGDYFYLPWNSGAIKCQSMTGFFSTCFPFIFMFIFLSLKSDRLLAGGYIEFSVSLFVSWVLNSGWYGDRNSGRITSSNQIKRQQIWVSEKQKTTIEVGFLGKL